MARVFFELDYVFDAPAAVVWRELVDWKGHERWIYATHVDLHGNGDPNAIGAEFTAWSGPMPTTRFGQRFSLQDRMRVAELRFDETTKTGTCRVDKMGPTLGGWAGFIVTPQGDRAHLSWTENVTVRRVPGLFSSILGRLGALGFRLFMSRLNRQLRAAA